MTNINITLTAPSNTITITSTMGPTQYVSADTKFRFDGPTGDTYLEYITATGKVVLYVDGVIKEDWS